MSTTVVTPQSHCRVGFVQADMTPPVGIYHRMWGAALHDRATGVHRPLIATAMLLESLGGSERLLVLGLDHCILDRSEIDAIERRIADKHATRVVVALTHTHGSGWMSRTRSGLPGGDLIGPYLDSLADTCARLADEALTKACQATIVYQRGRCDLARHRDYYDAADQRYVCGFNPEGQADDTLLVAKVIATDSGRTLGTVVNYACHPTTLAWENTLISPDYVGAMREVVEAEFQAPCLFVQGASGDLGPQEGFVGEVAVADRNGRRLGFAAAAALLAAPPPGSEFRYTGSVVSGAILGVWKHMPVEPAEKERWQFREFVVPLAYRPELPTVAATEAELAKWQQEESHARAANDLARVSECRARAEQMTRQLARLAAMPAGDTYPYTMQLLRVGDAVWLFCPGELYQVFQTTLRARFPNVAIMIATVCNDWQPGYLPAASAYGHGIYQDVIAAVAPCSLETVIDATMQAIDTLLNET
jgi:hypothetical protein